MKKARHRVRLYQNSEYTIENILQNIFKNLLLGGTNIIREGLKLMISHEEEYLSRAIFKRVTNGNSKLNLTPGHLSLDQYIGCIYIYTYNHISSITLRKEFYAEHLRHLCLMYVQKAKVEKEIELKVIKNLSGFKGFTSEYSS